MVAFTLRLSRDRGRDADLVGWGGGVELMVTCKMSFKMSDIN